MLSPPGYNPGSQLHFSPAIFSTGGEMYHTAPVVKIHETETQEIHFETPTTHYYIKPRPFVLAVLNPRRQTLAACA